MLDRRRRPERARPAAAPLHGGSVEVGGGPGRAGPGGAGQTDPAGERLQLLELSCRRNERVGIPSRGRRARRLQYPARHQQHLRQQHQSRLRSAQISASDAEITRAAVPSRRAQQHGRPPDRHARSSDRGTGVESVRAGAFAVRRSPDDDRARRQHSRVAEIGRGTRRRSRHRRPPHAPGSLMGTQATLRELQIKMQQFLLGETSGVTSAIVDAPPLSAKDRLAIYRNAYQVRLIDALHETFPVLHSLLGDEVWVELGEAFIAEYPSTFRSIRWYGRELPDFLTDREPFSGEPVLAEVARLEWTLSEVFDSPDAEPLPRTALSTVDPDRWGSLKFEFHPSLRRLAFHWNTAAVWKAMNADETPPRPERATAAASWLLWRQNLQNYFRSMNAVETAALESALRGLNFGEICERLGALLPGEEIPAAAASLLGTWADSGIITGISQ